MSLHFRRMAATFMVTKYMDLNCGMKVMKFSFFKALSCLRI
jgi:hypothetical protein